MTAKGWLAGSTKSWDKQKALFPEYITAFIKDTQPTAWAQVEKLLGPATPQIIPPWICCSLLTASLLPPLN
ncbi:MAG: hypothetical protein MUF15_27895 [Acidobacteria bacterium]|nr:hypothetical protein [Acidobacteriota bacterium]